MSKKKGYAVCTGAQQRLNRKYLWPDNLPTTPIGAEFPDLTVAIGLVNTVIVGDADGAATPYVVGAQIEYNGDGVLRTVTAVNTTTDTVEFAPALSAPTAAGKVVYHYSLDIAERHFDPIAVTRIEMWYGKVGLPTWQVFLVPTDDGGPPTAASLDVGDAVHFRIAVYDQNGKGRWTSIAQLLNARPQWPSPSPWSGPAFASSGISFMVVGAGLTPDANIVGLFEAAVAGAPTVQARLALNGVNYDSKIVTVTIT